MNNEATQTFVACCPKHGIPLHEAHSADGWTSCPACHCLYRVIIKDGKVSVIEDNKRTYNQSAILRWLLGIRYAAKMQLEMGKMDMSIT